MAHLQNNTPSLRGIMGAGPGHPAIHMDKVVKMLVRRLYVGLPSVQSYLWNGAEIFQDVQCTESDGDSHRG